MCQKLAEHLSFHMKYFDLDLKEKSEKTNSISPKKTPPKSSGLLGLIRGLESFVKECILHKRDIFEEQ